MKRLANVRIATVLLLCALLTGCPSNPPAGNNGSGQGEGGGANAGGSEAAGDRPVFTLAWSEYPSWSVFGVAHARKLINGEEGQVSTLEMKWNVDIVLKQLDYEPCITQYGSSAVDAVCITNMDVLSPSLGRASVAVLPTSTSKGADACIVVDIADLDALREHKVYGLEKSVSEYCVVRNLELKGKDEKDYQFTQKDPAQAAQAMQVDPKSTQAIMVWNPFVLQTLKKVEGSKRLFDSSTIPNEIVDMVVVAQDVLDKPGGKDFACAVIDTFYRVSDLIEAQETRDQALLDLARKFAPELTVEDMNQVVKETAFYKTPEAGTELFSGTQFQETMQKVVGFCQGHGMLDKEPNLGYGPSGSGHLRFDPSFMQTVQSR
jgi:NitT/TauT family transport system substrate-binding protein